MTSVRHTPRLSGPVQRQVPTPAPGVAVAAKRPVDGFERRSVTAALYQRGMTGPGVTALQQKLVSARFLSTNDYKSGPGVYGPRTEAAVKRLQAQVGLPVTGIAAPSTLAALASGVRYQPHREPEATQPLAVPRARLSETFSDEVTQPMGRPAGL